MEGVKMKKGNKEGKKNVGGRSLNKLADKTASELPKVKSDMEEGAMKVIMGRPTKYHEGIPELAFRFLSDPEHCHSKESCAYALGINPETLYAWLKKHKAFSNAVHAGIRQQEENYATNLANGQVKYSQGLMFVMKNRHKWADKIEHKTEHTISDVVKSTEDTAKPIEWRALDDKQAISMPAPSTTPSAPPTAQEGTW